MNIIILHKNGQPYELCRHHTERTYIGSTYCLYQCKFSKGEKYSDDKPPKWMVDCDAVIEVENKSL